MSTHLYFFRHGQVAANRLHRLCGRIDPPLTDKGRQQALACASIIDCLPQIDAIYSSPLRRALETAELATGYIAGLPKIVCDNRLLERDFGEIDGNLSLIKLITVWNYDCSFTKSNYGEESLLSLELRVDSFLAMLREHHPDQHVLVFSHGGIGTAIHTILSEDATRTGNFFKHFHLKNGEFASFLL